MTSGHISIGASADGNFQMMEIPIHFTDPVKFDSQIMSDIMMRDKSIKFPNLAGDEMVTIMRGGSQSLKISNENGYLEVGPMNTSYAHVYTDRPSFYFNKGILVNGTAVSLSNHTHTTFDRASAVLSGANVFSNIVVTDGIVTSIATRAMIAADVGAAAESHTHSYLPLSGGTLTGNITTSGTVYVGAGSEVLSTANIYQYVPVMGVGSYSQMIGGGNIHDNRWSGFYMGDNMTNAVNSSWHYYLIQRHNDSYRVITCWPLNYAGYVWWKRCTNGTWTSWMRINA